MCGICGIIEYRHPVDPEVLRRMTDALRHRGPDDEGFHHDGQIGLGFRRLKVLDPDGGHQPMSDGRFHMVFNGEIYNYVELREQLGGQFHTQSDSEVLLRMYARHGADCLPRLNGMFAFAIWDSQTQELFAARDRLGKKPFYYREDGQRFLFASEPKALLRHPDCAADLDPAALGKYLTYEYVPSPYCIFRGMRKLPPAHTLTWKNGSVTLRRWWEPTFSTAAVSEAEAVERLRDLLRDAVRVRLRSDVPLGVFLSGGLDSSAVLAMTCEHSARVETFTIGFQEPTFDESRHARRIASHFGASHHERVVGPQDLLQVVPRLAHILDEPFADASIIPTCLLAEYTRQHVTVALGGDGGDELFAGYPTFTAHRVAEALPAALQPVLRPLARALPVRHDYFSADFKLKQFVRGLGHPAVARNQAWLGSFDPEEQKLLLVDPNLADDWPQAPPAATDPLNHLIHIYQTTYLPDDILVKTDRATMACSLEARAPFLDYRLVEFANALPANLKMKGWRTKHVLKQAMRGKLPKDIIGRAKKGFGVPVGGWLRGDLRDFLCDMLAAPALARHGLFQKAAVARLIDEHLRGSHDHRKKLWTLLMFQMWHDSFWRRAD